MRLYIDNIACHIVGREPKLPGYDAKRLKSVDAWREGDDIDLVVASEPSIDQLFGDASNLHHAERFNATYHPARLEVDGVPLFEGCAVLVGVDSCDGATTYRVRLRRGGAEWARLAATTKLRDAGIDFSGTMSLKGIAESWSDDSPVHFLPLWRDSYASPTTSSVYSEQRTLMPHNYHPFLAILPIVERLVERAGYSLDSDFLRSERFRSLAMSGQWCEVESDAAYASMGFKAYRQTTTTATAGDDGRVYAWLPVMASNVGAVVDTVSPVAVTDEGVTLGDAYNNGGCFGFEEGRPIFRPKRDISVAFDYHLCFTTDYRIASSSHLQGFDRINLGTGCEVELKLDNPHIDRRDSLKKGIEYVLYIFDFDPSRNYKLKGYGEITEAITKIVMADDADPFAVLYSKPATSSTYLIHAGDWAIYDGYVEPTGRRRVEVDIRSPYGLYTHTTPKVFNDIFFGGGVEGQTLTLHSGCSVTPIFGGIAGYGEGVGWEDITYHNFSLATLLEALQQMFNLSIYSHEPSKRVVIEPRDDFYRGDVVDWRHRQVGDSIALGEGVVESYATTTLKYRPGDGVISRLDEQLGTETGSWSHLTEGYAAKYAENRVVNALFAPTVSVTNFAPSAPSAEVLTVGNRDSLYASDSVTPRVVLYSGMVTLPQGEWWTSSAKQSSYPHAAFHNTVLGDSLAFGDADGIVGLHRYYDTELREWEERETVELRLCIFPDEYRALFDTTSEGATIASLFRLSVGGHSSLFRLLAIDDYDARHHTARCRFLRTLND